MYCSQLRTNLVMHNSLHNIRYIISGAYEPPEGRKERPTPHYSVERHLNLNGRDTSLIWTCSQVGRKCCFHNQYTPCVRVVPPAYGAGLNKKENSRSKGSESGKRCTRACTSHVASGVENGQFWSAGYCILSPLRLE